MISKGAVLVPTDALFEDPTTHYVWIVKLNDTIERRDVKLGAEYGPFTRITSGLSTGDTVVVEGSPLLLKAGVKVKAKVVDARSFVEHKSSEGASP